MEIKSDNYRPVGAEDINYELNPTPPQLQISQNYIVSVCVQTLC